MGTWRTRVAVAGSLLAGPRPGSSVPQQGRRGRDVEGGTSHENIGRPCFALLPLGRGLEQNLVGI